MGLSLLYVLAGFPGCGADEIGPPNLVLITVDRLAADRLHCFGGPSQAGRSVCALGQRGTLFAWAASPGAAEASGAASVLTGLAEAVHGVGSDGQSFLADVHPTIAEDLSKAGYATAAFVESPNVNRSRRLDRGFDLYEDRLASPSRIEQREGGGDDLSGLIRAWIDRATAPWFVWAHVSRDASLEEVERLVSGLSRTLNPERAKPGVLFLALAGEAETITTEGKVVVLDQGISWRTHRVPLIWRPPEYEPALDRRAPRPVSYRLASPMDILPTLRMAARLPSTLQPEKADETASKRGPDVNSGRALDVEPMPPDDPGAGGDRFLLLTSDRGGRDVGLASQNYLYTRHASPLDGTGRPVASSSLIPLAARFASLPPIIDRLHNAGQSRARYQPGPWRIDVLHPESPVSRLEFHLALRLGAQSDARRIARNRKKSQ